MNNNFFQLHEKKEVTGSHPMLSVDKATPETIPLTAASFPGRPANLHKQNSQFCETNKVGTFFTKKISAKKQNLLPTSINQFIVKLNDRLTGGLTG